MTEFKPLDPDFDTRVRDSFARQKAMATLSRLKFPIAGTEFRRRTKSGCFFRIFPPRNAAQGWASRLPAGLSPSITARFEWKTICRPALDF